MVLLSGGIDSATALYILRGEYRTRALTFLYHGVSRTEVESARAIADRAGVAEHRFVRLPDLREAGDLPGGAFEGLPPTYIPLRNSVFYSLAASYAEETGASAIAGGHNRDDQAVFEDASPKFFSDLRLAFLSASVRLRRERLLILLPLARRTKVGVVRLASSLGVPLELTWSCHGRGTAHCWRCPGCESRMNVFREAGVSDPLSRAPRKIT